MKQNRMNKIPSLTLTAWLLALPGALPAAQPASDSIDVEGVMRVAARKLAAFDVSQPKKTAYPTDAKGAQWRTVGAAATGTFGPVETGCATCGCSGVSGDEGRGAGVEGGVAAATATTVEVACALTSDF